MKQYGIEWNDGTSTTHATYEAAVEAVRAQYPDAVVGHDGDLTDSGDSTLCWACEADAQDDPGVNACAKIRPVQAAAAGE